MADTPESSTLYVINIRERSGLHKVGGQESCSRDLTGLVTLSYTLAWRCDMAKTNAATKLEKQRTAGQLFSPRTPISATELFSGRYEQILKLSAAISQP